MKGFINGRRPLDIYTYIAEQLEIPEDPQTLVHTSQELLNDRFEKARLMPGAVRLLEYFSRHEIPMALATSTDQEKIPVKLKGKEFLLDFFQEVVGGDAVQEGKPSPEIFLKTAEKMNVDPSSCLVFEDSYVGAKAAALAGMHIVLVPSTHEKETAKEDAVDGACIEVLASLMDFKPVKYHLPPFEDAVHGVIHMNPLIFLSGTVVKGFGRGAKELGIRTANIDEASLSDELATAVTGIYAGWATVGDDECVYKMVMSIGWNPFYKNEKKTAEAWLLHEFPEDFYGEHLRLLVVGYLRPECDFKSLESLIEQIQEDARVAARYLEETEISSVQNDPRLKP